MEADWEFEIAQDAPAIDACWPGLVDLRAHPERIDDLAETAQLNGLAATLRRINAPDSLLWSAKCDVWDPGPVDPDELAAVSETAAVAVACYIDLLPRTAGAWATLDDVAGWSRQTCAALRKLPVKQGRVDLVVRSALVGDNQAALGVTAYLAGCGRTAADAEAALAGILRAFADTVCPPAAPAANEEKLQ